MSSVDADSDVRAIRMALESLLKRCDLPVFDPSQHSNLSTLCGETLRAHALIEEVHDALRELLRVDVAEAEESVAKLLRSRDDYREQCEEHEYELDKRLMSACELATAVTEFIGHISADESLAIHNIRMLAHDVQEAA